MNYTKDQFDQWNGVLNTLRNGMATVSFDTWIKPMELYSVTSDEVIVHYSNPANLPHLLSQYGNLVERAVKVIFGANYTVSIVESTPDNTDRMNDGENIISDFIKKQNAASSHASHDVYHYVANFPIGNRIRNCVIVLVKEASIDKTQLQLIIELPIHIKRGEVDHIVKELTIINDDLEPNQCYDIDILEGTIRFRTIVDYPEDVAGLDLIVSESMKIVEEDFIDIMQLIVRELAAIEKAGT